MPTFDAVEFRESLKIRINSINFSILIDFYRVSRHLL